jgi:sugar phosphate isomerase/epimerase
MLIIEKSPMGQEYEILSVKIDIMRIAYRVTRPEDVGRWDGDFAQLSVYRHWPGSMEHLEDSVGRLREKGVRYVMHPVGYNLLGGADEEAAIRRMAELSDLALILHDERAPDGGRIDGEHEERFRRILEGLSEVAHVSFENANDTADAPWFWERFAAGVTLDIGHVESAGLDSVEYVRGLSEGIVKRIDYVHMHRNNGLRGGLTDHWPLKSGCREIEALKELLKRTADFDVILEINETEEINDSIRLLRALWRDMKGG